MANYSALALWRVPCAEQCRDALVFDFKPTRRKQRYPPVRSMSDGSAPSRSASKQTMRRDGFPTPRSS